MALQLAAAAGATAAAAYLNAKYHIAHDVFAGSLNNAAENARKFIVERTVQNKLLMYHMLQDHAVGRPNALFLEYGGRSWTYKEFFDDLERVANWLMKDLGVKKGEMVAIDGPNSAEYLLLWFALDGIGACISFINCNLTGTPLVHSTKLCQSRFLIAEKSVENLVEPCREDLEKSGIQVVYYDQSFMEALSDRTPIPRERNSGIAPDSLRSLIYTSGTTGLPKGVMMLTGRAVNTARSIAAYLKLKPTDKFYTCLPLYHGAAQGLCVSPIIYIGGSVRLGRKFSHKSFWPEVSESGANKLQYVGELCRYLVNAPVHPLERKHNVEMAWGNGMRPDVWEKFRTRFNIPLIHELYAATDGLGACFNPNRGDFTRSAIALRGALWHWQNGNNEIRARIDADTEDLIRDANGFIVKSAVNEPGEVVHRVDPALAESLFKGYFGNDEASNKRWLRNVLQEGDLFFRSGDVMRVDSEGRVYFVDRLGDTFRWRSENVSTNEVADILGAFDQIAETSVYGVAVPHTDGRCGCATVVPSEGTSIASFDFARLAKHVTGSLPRYAVPIFLRMAPQLTYTGTFKIQKGQAKREGVDPDLIEKAGSKDQVFWLPPNGTSYVPFERADWEALKAGRVKL
ncbi:Hypothetical protein R9X50_00670200 [Acrodontium crateriforme]|uniref:Fatty acid transporter protein n=1 Tax=Acrodontium crateriforme TaxID=150365 RepID=A0AAQ3M9D5_9PEZI|nr:Hypothetical protein R9X50_00670200 [Acrodontium crateriforme]